MLERYLRVMAEDVDCPHDNKGETAPRPAFADWLIGDSEMARRIRALNWSTTPLGPREHWPSALRVSLNLALSSKAPMLVLWGPQFIALHNDACLPILSDAGTHALGRSAPDAWSSTWHVAEPGVMAALTRGESSQYEDLPVRMVRQGRMEQIYFTATNGPVYLDNGSIGGVLIIYQETTHAVERLREIERTQATLEAAMASTPDAVVIADANGSIVTFNEALATFHRFPNKESFARALSHYTATFEMFFPDGTPVPFEQWAMSRALCGETGANVERTIRRKDTGETWICSFNFAPTRNSRGEIMGGVVSARDITEQKRAERALRESELKYATIFEKSPYALAFSKSPQGTFVAVNDAFLRLFEYSREEVLGKTAVELGMIDEITFRSMIARVRSLGALRAFECIRYTKHGHERHVALSLDPVQIEDAKYVLVSMEDISARVEAVEAKRLVHESQELDRLKSRFLANISHEFRTPLALILGPTERLLMSRDTPEPVRRHLGMISRNAYTLLGYVNNLLDVAKIEAGRATLTYTRTDIAHLVRLAASHFQTLAGDKQFDFKLETPTQLIAEIDPEKVQRIVLNLLSNAFKFTPFKGSVRLTLKESAERVTIEVADAGPGIPVASREKVFDRFGTSNPGATGLGLAIVREFVTLHEGTISIGNAPEGGTLFVVDLPRKAPSGSRVLPEVLPPTDPLLLPTLDAAQPQRKRMTTGPLVLVIEDDVEMNRFIVESLDEHYRVESAFDGNEGLEKALKLLPDVILCDLMMPHKNGEEFVREARQCAALASTPIIVLSAKTDDALRITLLREGAQDYLMKPFVMEELRVRVENWVKRMLAETAAREAEEKYRGIVTDSGDAILVIDEKHDIVEWNQAAEKIFGYSRDEILGQSLDKLLPARHRLTHHTYVNRFAIERGKARKVDHAEAVGLRKNGEEFPIAATIACLRLRDELLMTAVVRDISEERRREEELSVLAEIGATLASLDDQQTLDEVVHTLARSFGDSAALFFLEREGDDLVIVASANRDPAIAVYDGMVRQTRFVPAPSHPIWTILKTRRGLIVEPTPELFASLDQQPLHRELLRAMHPHSIMAVPLLAGDRCLGILRLASSSRTYDARDLKLLEEVGRRCAMFAENARLHQAERLAIQARDEVLGVVAHDLRNPLGVVLLEASKLASMNGSDERIRQTTARMDRCARRMHRIVEDLLDVVSLDGGKMSLDLVPQSAIQLVTDVAEAQTPLFAQAALSCQMDVPPTLPEISVDRHRLMQVFENLVGNAIKFSKPGQTIVLGAKQQDGDVLFWVQDQGAGIEPENQAHVFDRFWHGDRRKGAGTGLGLAIVKAIVELHGGRVWVESHPGEGSSFYFTIPAGHSERAAAA